MELECLLFIFAGIGFFVALPLSWVCYRRSASHGTSLRLGVIALLISIVAIVGGFASYYGIASMRHIVIEP